MPQLGLDPQEAAVVLDVAVDPAQHVPLERRQHCLAVALEDQRARLVQPVDLRLAQTATEGSPDEPLKLDAPCGSRGQELDQSRVSLIGANAKALQLTGLEERRIAEGECLAECPPPVARLPFERSGEIARNVTLGLAQAHEQEQRRARGAELGKPADVIVHITAA